MAAEARAPRRRIVTALVVVATVVAFLAILASWVKQQALDTEEWTKTSTDLLEQESVRTALATYLVDQLYTNVDVAAELRSALRPQIQPLAGPLAAGLREVAERLAIRALEGPRLQQAWKVANQKAHKELLDVINDRNTNVSTANGEVTLDLRSLVGSVGDESGIGAKIGEKLPPDAGQLHILSSDELGAAQTIARVIDGLAIVLAALWLALWALAMYLAVGRRREAMRAIGLGLIVAGAAVLILQALAGNAVVDALAKTPAAHQAADDTWTVATRLLTEIGQSVITVGIMILIGSWLAGRTAPAVAFRRAMAPYMRERPDLTYGFVALIFAILVLWAPARAFTRPGPLIVIAILTLLGTEALRRLTAREFPDAPMPEGGIGESIADIRSSIARRKAP